MPSRSHTSQKRWISLVTLLRAIDVIRTVEDSTIIWRCVAIYYLEFIGTYVINVEKEKRKKKNTRCLQRVTTQKCDSRRIEQFISIFMLQTITIILLILYFITQFFSLLSFVWDDHIRHCDLSRGKNEQKKNRKRKSVCACMCVRVCVRMWVSTTVSENESENVWS